MTIAIHLQAGNFTLLTATDTQETYTSGEKIDSGKIMGGWRADPPGAINIALCGWSHYALALSQDILGYFQDFSGTMPQLDGEIRRKVREFHKVYIRPYVGRVDHDNLPNCSLLIAARHQGVGKLWATDEALTMESNVFRCVGIGSTTAEALLSRLYPKYPSLDSIAILAAYVIYRVKHTVEGCGLNTEIRFIRHDSPGMVPFDLIKKWEDLFQKYDRMQRDIFYHAMNFAFAPLAPPEVPAFPPQMKTLSEAMKDVEEMRSEFERLRIP